jgi:hypothetical protein
MGEPIENRAVVSHGWFRRSMLLGFDKVR